MPREKKYTRGEWRFDERALNCIVCEKRVIANCGAYYNNVNENIPIENNANAQLVSAAPDLLEALEDMIRVFNPDKQHDFAKSIIDKANKAIGKAYGLKTED